jgi:hypothetical protein
VRKVRKNIFSRTESGRKLSFEAKVKVGSVFGEEKKAEKK